jgi:signal transduction histidine kinase
MLKEPATERLFVQLFDHQPDAVVWYQPIFETGAPDRRVVDFEVQYANKATIALLSAPRTDIRGQRLCSMPWLNEATISVIFTQCLDVWNSDEPIEYTYYNPAFDRYFRVERTRVEDGVLSITRDRTNEHASEVQAKMDRDLLTSILDASINGLYAVEAVRDEENKIVDFRFLMCNQMLLQVLGKREEEVVGKSYLLNLPTSKENGMFELKRQVVETGEPVETEFYYKGEGVDGWFQISMAPLGKNGVVETFTDITESRRDKELLAKSAEQFRTVVNTSKAGMFTLLPVTNAAGEVIDFRFGIVNQAVASYIGQTAEVLTGSLASVYFPAYTTNGLFDIYKDNYLSGKPYNFDFHYEDGYDVFFNIDVVNVGDQVLVTFTDHTAYKRLQRELEQTVAELKRSNESLEQFTSAASHDLKEPIRKVHFFTNRLKTRLEGQLSAEDLQLMERVETATDRMRLLIDDLLNYSHVRLGQLEPEDIDLNEKVNLILTDLELMVSDKRAKVEVVPLPVVTGHRRQLQQLFHNLIGNALKYNKPGVPPEIHITARTVRGDEAGIPVTPEDNQKTFHLIEVSDNGIGFEQQYADRIFNIFTRLHGNNEYTGTGVGLAIAKKVVENHNGYIAAESEPGNGATFKVLLPV